MTAPTASNDRRGNTVAVLIALTVATLGFLITSLMGAPAASAAGGEGKADLHRVGDVNWDLGGTQKNWNTPTKSATTGKQTNNAVKKPTVAPPPVVESKTATFNGGGACVMGEDDTTVCYTFAEGIDIGNCTAYPPADRGYGYNGNAIPLPALGERGQSRLVGWTLNVTKQEIKDVEAYRELSDPEDPNSWIEVGEKTDTSYLFEYKWNCNYQTAPEVSTEVCATWVKAALNGPYDQDYKPMKSILENGTNTRMPDGKEYGTLGVPQEGPSTFGEAMREAGLNPKTGTPTLSLVQNYCVPTNKDGFKNLGTDESSTLGRYEIRSTTWYSRARYYHFTQARVSEIYPAVVRSKEFKDGYQVIDILPPTPTNLTTYGKLICYDGTSADGIIQRIWVGKGTVRDWRVLDWGDSAADYYSWNCGDSPVDPNRVREKDFLQCDTYGQQQTAPYQFDRKDYTYHSYRAPCSGPEPQCHDSRYVDFGTDWSGTTCPRGGTMHDGQCLGWTEGWYDATARDATPDGWQDNGSNWFKKAAAPDGWFDNGTDYESTKFPNIIVDHKYAAPIEQASQIVDGKVIPLEKTGATYRLSSAADPVYVSWQRVRINTRDGRDVNTAGKNVLWDYQYRLAPWSSPMLKNTDVNAVNQPYHGWVDTMNQVAVDNMLVDRKWEPDKNFGYSTMPYGYEYTRVTYHKETENVPRQTTTREWDSYDHVDWRYWWGEGGADCGRWANGDPWCREPVYEWRHHTETVVAPPPPGCFDDGTWYVCPTDVRDATPDGYENWGNDQWRKKAAPPIGWHDDGTQWVSDNPLNDGYTGGISFNNWRKWPSYEGMTDCTVNAADYSNDQRNRYDKMKCGDNVTDRTRSAYFRYFMSTTAGANGWQVTPWWRVTADIQTEFSAVNQILPDADGDADLDSNKSTGKWLRQQYECPGQPFLVNVARIAQ